MVNFDQGKAVENPENSGASLDLKWNSHNTLKGDKITICIKCGKFSRAANHKRARFIAEPCDGISKRGNSAVQRALKSGELDLVLGQAKRETQKLAMDLGWTR